MTGLDPTVYSPRRAWRIAIAYALVCVAIGRLAGTRTYVVDRAGLDDWLGGPLDQDLWTLAVIGVVVVAYGFVWPRGTLTHGRARRPVSQMVMGLLWGLPEAMLLLTPWVMAVEAGMAPGWASVLSIVVVSGYLGVWHDRFWDVYVSPDHNVVSFNPVKVAACHVPNLVVSFTHLARYDEPMVFFAAQTTAIVISVWVMRFPARTDPDIPRTVEGVPVTDTPVT